MTNTFVKLYGSILDSSIWQEPDHVRLVWITMLAMADADGVVQASLGGLAHRAMVSRQKCKHALEALSSPDSDDRSGVKNGIRIEKVQGGWSIVNHRAYRDLRTPKQVRDAERQQRHRRDNRDRRDTSHLSQGVAPEAEAEAEDSGASLRSAPPSSPSINQSDRAADFELIAPKANPLVGDRVKLEKEVLELVAFLAEELQQEPIEVLAKASGWRGKDGVVSSKLNPANMTDDRLLHTARWLRSHAVRLRAEMAGGQPETWYSRASADPRVVQAWEGIRDGLSSTGGADFIRAVVPLRIDGDTLVALCPSRDHAQQTRGILDRNEKGVTRVLDAFKLQTLKLEFAK